jgi:hypothetical protein
MALADISGTMTRNLSYEAGTIKASTLTLDELNIRQTEPGLSGPCAAGSGPGYQKAVPFNIMEWIQA